MPEKLQFKISSALKNVIGKDLIIDDFVAIFELVKNSFDAFAENVIINFVIDNNKKSKIFIIDDGKGMSKEDLINKWLFVAFSAKKDGTEDKVKKKYSGYKGIGRFSCDRLGRTLKIQAKQKLNKKIHCIKVNWDEFEKNSKDEFINIDVAYSEREKFSLPENIKKRNKGIVLEIGLLRDENLWDRNKLIRLKKSLQKLIDPIGDTKNIEIKCAREIENDKKVRQIAIKKNENPIIINEKIENTIFEVLESKTTKLKAKINTQGLLQVDLIDRDTFIYSTKEDISKQYPELINSHFYAEISFINTAAKITFARRMGIPVIQYGSLFLIRNGFRVFPIGEEANDYWGFDRRKQQGYARFLGSRDLLGFINISGDEDKFAESSSRNQGLIQTKAAIELSDCVKRCLVKLEAYVVDITWADKLDKTYNNAQRMGLDDNRYKIIELIEKLSKSKNIDVINYNHDLISILNKKAERFAPSLKKLQNIADNLNDKELIKQIELAKKTLTKANVAQQEAEKNAEEERQARKKAEKKAEKSEIAYQEEIKRNIFLTGSESRDKELLEGFIHQIILYASQSKGSLQNILQSPTKLKKMSVKELKESFSKLLEITEKIISTSRFATTANFRLQSSMINEDFNAFVKEYLEKNCNCL